MPTNGYEENAVWIKRELESHKNQLGKIWARQDGTNERLTRVETKVEGLMKATLAIGIPVLLMLAALSLRAFVLGG